MPLDNLFAISLGILAISLGIGYAYAHYFYH